MSGMSSRATDVVQAHILHEVLQQRGSMFYCGNGSCRAKKDSKGEAIGYTSGSRLCHRQEAKEEIRPRSPIDVNLWQRRTGRKKERKKEAVCNSLIRNKWKIVND